MEWDLGGKQGVPMLVDHELLHFYLECQGLR